MALLQKETFELNPMAVTLLVFYYHWAKYV